jgi:hypothetical protein
MDFESLYKTALGTCQMMIRQRAGGASAGLTHEVIRETVNEVLGMTTFAMLSDAYRIRLIGELEERFTVYAPTHRTLSKDDDHIAWLHSKLGSITWKYWDRYILFLQDRMAAASVDSIQRVVNDVLSRLEDPDRVGVWDRRGLVMGHVQSGKTANYCGLICKAADAGYKVIIVLSGLHNNLRCQTQIRLDEGFLGIMSEPRGGGATEAFRRAGVGLYDQSLHANTGTNRTELGDFNTTVANQFGIHPGGLPLLFVVKKNATVLNNLLRWISSSTDAHDPISDRRYVRNVPVLVIDDEADLASIDTRQQTFDELGNPDPDHNPSRINELIRKVLRAFEKVAYVGYTATPFANIFIHDRGYTSALGDDLFPRSFIVSIPPPSNYLGPARTFGITGEDDAGLEVVQSLPVVRIVSDHAQSDAVDEENGWMPPKLVRRTEHRPFYNGVNCIPPSLRTAMMTFILAATVRKLREAGPHHNSMLVHVVRYTKVQRLVTEQVSVALREILQRLQHGDGERTPTIESEFRELWDKDFIPTSHECRRIVGDRAAPHLPEWNRVTGGLREVTASIRVKTVNGSAGDVLDYEEYRSVGTNVIAIGADKLSRGLTLEGLSVSYFLRASQMYDTLMQMGRWFGYRDGYVDVCRLYTTGELLEWFTHIAAASEELQHEFQYMCNVGGTPKDYGLKVRSHPVMLVTSAVKMRNGEELRLSFSGDISETIIFDRDPPWIARNFSVTEKWLASLGRPVPDSYTWKSKDAQSIIDFLSGYTSHDDARLADTSLLTRYITEQLSRNELTEWTVRLCSSGLGDARSEVISGLPVGLIKRKPFPQEQRSDRYTIRQLVSPADELCDLTPEQIKAALDRTVENWRANPNRRPDEVPPDKPGRREAREFRPITNGLLLLYPLDAKHAGLGDSVKPIIGIAVSFPKSQTAREITYTVNNVFTRRGGDDDSL